MKFELTFVERHFTQSPSRIAIYPGADLEDGGVYAFPLFPPTKKGENKSTHLLWAPCKFLTTLPQPPPCPKSWILPRYLPLLRCYCKLGKLHRKLLPLSANSRKRHVRGWRKFGEAVPTTSGRRDCSRSYKDPMGETRHDYLNDKTGQRLVMASNNICRTIWRHESMEVLLTDNMLSTSNPWK